MERDRLTMFVRRLIQHQKNVRELLDVGGVRILVDLVTLAHLHTSRAVIPTQTNVIEAGPNMHLVQEKEWFYNTDEGERKGPFSFNEVRLSYWFLMLCLLIPLILKFKELHTKGLIHARTRCWATGLDGWRTMAAVPQLRWCLLAKGSPVLNESDLATLILNILIKMCEYFPSRY